VGTLRERLVAAVACAAAASAACTSTSTSFTSPTADKCQVTAQPPAAFDSAGGSGSVAVSAARDCTWAVATDVAWVTITGTRSGQGDGTIAFAVAANPAPAARSGALSVGSESLPLSQAGAPCRYAITRGSDSIGATGGSLSFQLTTLAGCSWTASPDASWITIRSGGTGNASATVSLGIAANAGQSRVGHVNVAGQIYTVNQEAAAPLPAPAPSPTPAPTPTPAPSPTPAPLPAPQPTPSPGATVSLVGTVLSVSGSCPNLSLGVGGRSVTTDKSTRFKGLKCEDVKLGTIVSVDGTTAADGTVQADVLQKAGT
jgi:uncharacterized protein DUF5666/all-beta uncharacterized protein/BACON domain-containing protein